MTKSLKIHFPLRPRKGRSIFIRSWEAFSCFPSNALTEICSQDNKLTVVLRDAWAKLPDSSSRPLPATLAQSRNLAHASLETAVHPPSQMNKIPRGIMQNRCIGSSVSQGKILPECSKPALTGLTAQLCKLVLHSRKILVRARKWCAKLG